MDLLKDLIWGGDASRSLKDYLGFLMLICLLAVGWRVVWDRSKRRVPPKPRKPMDKWVGGGLLGVLIFGLYWSFTHFVTEPGISTALSIGRGCVVVLVFGNFIGITVALEVLAAREQERLQQEAERPVLERQRHEQEVSRLTRETTEEQAKLRLAEARQKREAMEQPQLPADRDRRQAQRFKSKLEIDYEVKAFEEIEGPALTNIEREKAFQRVLSRIENDPELSVEAKQRLTAQANQLVQRTDRKLDLFKN